MELVGRTVVITGAGRGFGRGLALRMGRSGARLFVSARSLESAQRVADEVRADSGAEIHAAACDLSRPETVLACAERVRAQTDHVDVLVNNAARYLDGPDLWDADDVAIVDTVASGATGTVLTTKHFLPLLRKSAAGADVVNLISSAAEPRDHRSDAHPAFYAAKAAQAGLADVLSARLRPEGIRVISLYPPDFDDTDPLTTHPDGASRAVAAGAEPPPTCAPDAASHRSSGSPLSADSVADCVLFALGQPRDCFIRSFHFEQL